MKIQIITEREIKEEDYWGWAESVIDNINKVKKADIAMGMKTKFITSKDFEDLLILGEFVMEDDYGHTKAKTTYRIVR
jgi:hypothetical protein